MARLKHRDVVDWLRDWMEANEDMTALEVGKRAGYSTNGLVSAVLRRDKAIPLERLNDWCRALKVHGQDRDDFVLLAHLQDRNTPRHIADAYWSLRARVDALEDVDPVIRDKVSVLAKRLQELELKLTQALADNARLTKELAKAKAAAR